MPTLEKRDLRKELKHLYNPPTKNVVEVDVPPMNFLMLDGSGDPNTALEYRQAIEALYGVAYTLKFASKKQGIDFTVMALEGLWWMDDMGSQYGDFDFAADKNLWKWTMMMVQPDHITPPMVEAAIEELRRRKNPAALDKVRFERFHEGLCAQIMHIGPYSAEKPNIERVHAYIAEHGCEPAGRRHEIYLSDLRRTAPEKLRTIVRQPMRKRSG